MKATLEDLEREFWLRARNSGSIYWTTKEGKQIPIKDMSDAHLVNTINMLRTHEELEELYSEYTAHIWSKL